MEQAESLRRGLGALAVAVCVVTTLDEALQAHGATGMAWGEETDPPLLLTTLRRASTTRRLVGGSGVFGINVLGFEHRDLSHQFASGGDRFRGVVRRRGTALGVPLLADAIATFECTVEAIHAFGTLDIVVGRIAACIVTPGGADPAVHVRGRLLRTIATEGADT